MGWWEVFWLARSKNFDEIVFIGKIFGEFTLSVHISDWNSPNRNIKINFLSQIHFIKQFQVFIDGSKENLALF